MPIFTKESLEFVSRSPEQTRRLGARLGTFLKGGEIIALEGGLGAGKTVFAQGVGMGWGASARLISPTYVLVRLHERYQDHIRLCHIDLYRLNSIQEVEYLGLDEYLGKPDIICLVEWPDRHTGLFPPGHLWIHLRVLDEYRRSLTFQALGPRHKAILDVFRQEIIGR